MNPDERKFDQPLAYLEGGAYDGVLVVALPDGFVLGDEYVTPATKLVASLRYRKTAERMECEHAEHTPFPVYKFVEVVPGT